MKRPNKLLNKKYISSLVIAAFLILSVLTAYNIQFGNNRQEKKDTDVTETIGNNDDVISSGEARVENGEEGRLDDNSDSRTGIGGDNTGADTGESRPADEEAENGGNDQSQVEETGIMKTGTTKRMFRIHQRRMDRKRILVISAMTEAVRCHGR